MYVCFTVDLLISLISGSCFVLLRGKILFPFPNTLSLQILRIGVSNGQKVRRMWLNLNPKTQNPKPTIIQSIKSSEGGRSIESGKRSDCFGRRVDTVRHWIVSILTTDISREKRGYSFLANSSSSGLGRIHSRHCANCRRDFFKPQAQQTKLKV